MRGGILAVICVAQLTTIVASATLVAEADRVDLVDSIYKLETLFVEQQYQLLPIGPPSMDVLVQPHGTVLPVDWKMFPKAFIKQMYAEMDSSGYPLYRVSVYEDPSSRETVFLNSYGTEVYRLEPEENYDPYAWQKAAFDLKSGQVLDEWSRWIYDPAHIATIFTLIPEVFIDSYLAMQDAEAALKATAMDRMAATAEEDTAVSVSMALVPVYLVASAEEGIVASLDVMAMSSIPLPPLGDTNSVPGEGGSTSNLLVELAISLPEGFGHMDHIELFCKDELVYTANWSEADSWIPTYGQQTVHWIDPTSSNKTQRFYLVSDGADSDGDGHSDLYEAWVGQTASNTYNDVNADADDLHDWWETKLFGGLSQTGTNDFDSDGLLNNEEVVLLDGRVIAMHSDPALADSDDEGLDDYQERRVWNTDPMDADTDHDGRNDATEVLGSPPTDPHNPDTVAPTVMLIES